MKLIIQIAFGVFFGTISSQFAFDSWHTYKENIAKEAKEKILAEQDKVRLEQNERIRALFLQGRQDNAPPAGFIPDDAQVQKIK